MSIAIATVYDCTGPNLPKVTIPAGVVMAGYDTGSGVAWSTEQFHEHPNALHIDQDPAAADFSSDLLDSENGAVAVGSSLIPQWYKESLASFTAGKRPGQRHPSIYQSANNVTANVNALIAGGVTSGPGLWVADWNLSDPQAVTDVQTAAGPFPIIGVQFSSPGLYDISVFSEAWLTDVSKMPDPTPPAPTSGTQYGWAWCGKCQGLFWAAGLESSHCPAGGQHEKSGDTDYGLSFETP